MATIASKLSSIDGITKTYLEAQETLSLKEFIADGAITANTLVYITTDGKVKEATAHTTGNVYGVAQTTVETDKTVNVGILNRVVTAGSAIIAGDALVVGDDGKAVKKIITATAFATAFAGSAFTNQPATDGVTIVSDNIADITQVVTIYGTANGAPLVLVSESMTLTGTSDVNSIATDWALILGWSLSASCAGSIELSETSGGLEIDTITTGNLTGGITAATAPNAYSAIPQAKGNGATTKSVGYIGTLSDGTTSSGVVALTGDTLVDIGTLKFATIDTILAGDVESGVDLTVQTAAATSGESTFGLATESAALNALCEAYVTPVLD